jgi:hypothetical protein
MSDVALRLPCLPYLSIVLISLSALMARLFRDMPEIESPAANPLAFQT